MSVIRGKFEEELQELQDMLVKLAQLADESLEKAFKALETKNVELALEVMDDDTDADILYEEINDFAILLIAKQSPVAIDLRRIISVIKIATDLERIADFAVNLAKSAIRIGDQKLLSPFEKIRKMFHTTREMLKLSMEAFQEESIAKAKSVADMDDRVDDLYGETIRELLEINKQNNEYASQISQLSFVCRYLERTGDHITNISEAIFYLVKGRHFDLNE